MSGKWSGRLTIGLGKQTPDHYGEERAELETKFTDESRFQPSPGHGLWVVTERLRSKSKLVELGSSAG